MRILDKTVAALACPPGRKDALFFDEEMKGFALRVTSSGGKVFLLQYRIGGVRRRMPLGEFPAITAAQARKRAEKVRGQVSGGDDPWSDQRQALAAKREAERLGRAQRAAELFTFVHLVEAWHTKALVHRRKRYATDARYRLLNYFAAWKERAAGSITRNEVIIALDRIEAERGTISARRALSYARACYGWAVKRGQLGENPFQGVAAPGKENARDRVLSDAELGAVWRAAETLPVFHRGFFRMLVLTAQRREEVAGMRWKELSADLQSWTIPRERAKNDRAHLVHLSEPARAILTALPCIEGAEYVFPGRRNVGHITGFSYAKERLVAAIAIERATAGLEPATLPDWRFHDLRRTCVTALAGMGFAPHVADRLLNHATGAIQGVAAVYQRNEFLAERKAALDAWAVHVLRAADGTAGAGNVVRLRASG
jgi:integrase